MIFANYFSHPIPTFHTRTYGTRFFTSLPDSVFEKTTEDLTDTPFDFPPGNYQITLIDLPLLTTGTSALIYTANIILGYFYKKVYFNGSFKPSDIDFETFHKPLCLIYNLGGIEIYFDSGTREFHEMGFVGHEVENFPLILEPTTVEGEGIVFVFVPVWMKMTHSSDPFRAGNSNLSLLINRHVVLPNPLNYIVFLKNFNEGTFSGEIRFFFEFKKIS